MDQDILGFGVIDFLREFSVLRQVYSQRWAIITSFNSKFSFQQSFRILRAMLTNFSSELQMGTGAPIKITFFLM